MTEAQQLAEGGQRKSQREEARVRDNVRARHVQPWGGLGEEMVH